MQNIRQLKERLCKELEEYSDSGRLDMHTLQIIDTIAHTVKNLNKILDEKAKEENRYSEGYFYGTNDRYSSYPNSATDMRHLNNYSGRMTDSHDDVYNSRRYSMGNDAIIEKLRNLMNDAHDERIRQEFETFINRMERI